MLKPAVVTATILDRPTCVPVRLCWLSATKPDLDATIEALKPIVSSTTAVGMCWRCGDVIALYAIA
jgi:hypothetical protein